MEFLTFLDALHDLTIDDVRALALDIDAMTATTAEEIDITRAFLHIESTLRRQHRLREASIAGHRAGEQVLDVARRANVELPDTAVTRVARWADTVARAMVAGSEALDDLALFRHGCRHIETLAAVTRPVADGVHGAEISPRATVELRDLTPDVDLAEAVVPGRDSLAF